MIRAEIHAISEISFSRGGAHILNEVAGLKGLARPLVPSLLFVCFPVLGPDKRNRPNQIKLTLQPH